jgi:hypothetical protein
LLLIVEALLVGLGLKGVAVVDVGRVVQVSSVLLLLLLSCLVRDVLFLQEGWVVVMEEVTEGATVGKGDR